LSSFSIRVGADLRLIAVRNGVEDKRQAKVKQHNKLPSCIIPSFSWNCALDTSKSQSAWLSLDHLLCSQALELCCSYKVYRCNNMTSKSVFVTHSWHSLFSLSHTHRPAASKANGTTSGTHSGGGGSRSRANMSAYASGVTVGAAAGSGGVRVMLEGKNVTPQSLLRPVQRGKNGANNANNSSAVAVGVDGAAAAAAAAAVQGEAERRRSSNKLSSNSGEHLHKLCEPASCVVAPCELEFVV
jgi:hypothetical protein